MLDSFYSVDMQSRAAGILPRGKLRYGRKLRVLHHCRSHGTTQSSWSKNVVDVDKIVQVYSWNFMCRRMQIKIQISDW